ncbi:MAG: glycosyltransferase family 39 protein [Bacteroidota bacterium]
MMQQLKRLNIYGLLAAWVVLNLWQATTTGLDADEAYYAFYAEQLSWGYFDHPPLVALLISMGNWLPGELGLRFFNVLVSGLSWYGMWLLLDRPKAGDRFLLFAVAMLAMPLFQVYGFITTPDGPLLCGAVWFFWAYRRFWQQPNWTNALLWGGIMSLMLYGKYHGILVIFFTVLSNRKLWLKPSFYLAGFFGAALFVPHLYWQYLHDFPTFRYHLIGRQDPYEIGHTIGFVLNQLVVAGPLIFPLTFLALFGLKREDDVLLRAFRWVSIGFWVFFLNSTFKGSTEAHWTAVLSIGFVYSIYHYALGRARFTRNLLRLGGATAILFVVARVWLALDVIPLPAALDTQFEHRQWTQDLVERAGERTIVFENSYRDASLVRFYAGHPAWTFTNIHYRPSQYDLRMEEGKQLHQQAVYYVGNSGWNHPDLTPLTYGKRRYGAVALDNFPVLDPLQIYWSPEDWEERAPTQPVSVTIYNPYPDTVYWDHPSADFRLSLLLEKGIENWRFLDLPPPTRRAIPPDSSRLVVTIPWDSTYCPVQAVGLGFRMGNLGTVLQSALLDTERCESVKGR